MSINGANEVISLESRGFLWPLVHQRQLFEWDCGIACVLMVIGKKNGKGQADLRKSLENYCKVNGINQSTWTIDLCYMLKLYKIPHEFYTKTFGVDEQYLQSPFYKKVSAKDQFRILRKFDDARFNEINVFRKKLSLENVIQHLRKGPAIVLTNSKLLKCKFCRKHLVEDVPENGPYEGHYIVLCGCNSDVIFYRNPASFDHICQMDFRQFDKARKSFGTDEDVILVF